MINILIIFVMDILLVLAGYQYFCNHFRNTSKLATARLNYIRILIDTVYTYYHHPELMRKHLQKEMAIKKLMAYHVVDNHCGYFFTSRTKVSTNDQLLYMLHKEGFTPRELCIIFELNNINSVYVKCHRINKKLYTNGI